MSLSVVIHDYDSGNNIDITPRVLSVDVSDSIDGPSTVTVATKGLTETHAFDDVTVYYGGTKIFSGVIEDQTDILRGGGTLHRFSSLNGRDWSLKLENRIVNEIYENMTVEDILADLFAKYPAGVTRNNVVETNKIIESITWNYVYLSDCIEQLAEITGWRWYVDENHDLHFFDTTEGTGPVVFSTTTSGGLARNILKDSIQMRTEIDGKTANRVWVIGPRQAAAAYVDQYWTGDGLNDTFAINLEPNYPQVFEGGVEKTIELDRGQSSTDKDYLYDKKNRLLKRVAGPLSNGVQLRLHHRPTTQIIDYFEDSSSIARYGIYEKAIKDRKITERMAARSRGRAELKRRSSERTTLSFSVFGNVAVRRGLRYRIVIPELSLDQFFLCTGVSTSIAAPDAVNVTKTVEMEAI